MTYRRAARVDDNQSFIVKGLRKMGCSVLIVSQLKNCFDILVGFKGINIAFEIKDGNKPPSQRKLTEGEQKFFDEWNGQVAVVESLEEAIKKIYEIIHK
jgi:hypothetical protein